jgi:1-acyl-sn-glycerol-3-phosphate acyltransferase
MAYRVRWWLTGVIARVYSRYLFKDVEIVGSPAHDGPRLIVANHLSGLLDAIVIIRLLGGLPHILAKSTLFHPWPLGLVFRALGIIPLYRRIDGVDMDKNESSFRAVTKVLTKGRTVLIFPEGKVTDDQELQEIRTGAARMTLEAIQAGARNLAIIPVGITYDNKISSRPRILASVGRPIPADEIREIADGGPVEEDNHRLVDQVTGLVTERLGAVSPNYGSFVCEQMMMNAAAIHLRTGMTRAFDEPTMADLRTVAQRLADASNPPDGRSLDATARYEFAVTSCGIEDGQIQPRPRTKDLARVAFFKGLIVLLLAPIALLGLTANLAAILLVLASGALVSKPMSKGTIRAVTGIVAFPAMWAVQILIVGAEYPWLTALLMFFGLVVLIVGFNQLMDLIEAVRDWWSFHNSVALLPDLYGMRREAEEELADVLGTDDPSSSPG